MTSIENELVTEVREEHGPSDDAYTNSKNPEVAFRLLQIDLPNDLTSSVKILLEV